jgi:hypothetical protein
MTKPRRVKPQAPLLNKQKGSKPPANKTEYVETDGRRTVSDEKPAPQRPGAPIGPMPEGSPPGNCLLIFAIILSGLSGTAYAAASFIHF